MEEDHITGAEMGATGDGQSALEVSRRPFDDGRKSARAGRPGRSWVPGAVRRADKGRSVSEHPWIIVHRATDLGGLPIRPQGVEERVVEGVVLDGRSGGLELVEVSGRSHRRPLDEKDGYRPTGLVEEVNDPRIPYPPVVDRDEDDGTRYVQAVEHRVA